MSSSRPGSAPSDHKTPLSPSIIKLRKIPPIPTRHRPGEEGFDDSGSDDSDTIDPAKLGLNQIRTRSEPLAHAHSIGTIQPKFESKGEEDSDFRSKASSSFQQHASTSVEGKRVHWSHSKSLKIPSPSRTVSEGCNSAFAKEMQSPRFQAILRLTSGRKKIVHDIKSFSHELDSKGVRALPFWKSRAIGRMEDIMAMVRSKFDKLKEEVNADLGIFAGDLVSVLEETSESHPDWKECFEDLLVIARQSAKMTPGEFWLKCDGIVQNLDDRRQELPMGTLKQVHTRLLFILTRCTRLVQFQKESGYGEDHVLAAHKLSDLGMYPERIDIQTSKLYENDKSNQINDQNHVTEEVNTGKRPASVTGSFRMSSWKKLPSAAERNRKEHDYAETKTPSKETFDNLKHKEETENIGTSVSQVEHTDESSKSERVNWGVWDQQHLTYEDSFICRICEVEIPMVYVEQHSRICTIVDRCDLKGLSVNERLERVAETLEKIIEFFTPKISDTGSESPEIAIASESKRNTLSRHYSEDVLDCGFEADNSFLGAEIHNSTNASCESRDTTPDQGKKASSAGSLTPRSPLVTPRMSQIELLLTRRRTISQFESYDQICKLLDIARSVVNINNHHYSTLEYMIERLEDLKYVIQDRKVDALVVETFGRCIEKLLQEKYILLCGQIDDEKGDLLNTTADDDSSTEEDAMRSLRASPIILCTKDRTSIEDFEIIKPISRGAFGRVFLARKRATGDLFAIKVLKKADMIRKNAVESILAERDILISVRNPFVVRFFYSFTCRENLYLVMEYLNGGDLFSLLRNLGCLEEDMARIYIAEVVLALEYLHSLNVIHRDLKPDNLLIGPDGHIKLTDFGLSKVGLINSTDDLSGPSAFIKDDDKEADSSLKRKQRKKHSVVGTPDYLAPEILLGMGHGATADWWSVGVILFELLVGIPPFNAEHPQQIFTNIVNRDIPWPRIPDEMSSEAYDLINKLLNDNPVQRLGATGAGEVKRHPYFRDINWDTLARQKAAFIPSAEAHDTSYFMSRYIWNAEQENVNGGSDFDDTTETGSPSCSSGTYSIMQDEDGDECGNLADFGTPTLDVKYSFSNFSFKNLSQLASMNYDLVTRSNKESIQDERPSESDP